MNNPDARATARPLFLPELSVVIIVLQLIRVPKPPGKPSRENPDVPTSPDRKVRRGPGASRRLQGARV